MIFIRFFKSSRSAEVTSGLELMLSFCACNDSWECFGYFQCTEGCCKFEFYQFLKIYRKKLAKFNFKNSCLKKVISKLSDWFASRHLLIGLNSHAEEADGADF